MAPPPPRPTPGLPRESQPLHSQGKGLAGRDRGRFGLWLHREAAVQNLPLEMHLACWPGVGPGTTPSPRSAVPHPTTQAFSQAACSCGLSHRTGATAPSPHLQPSSSSSWPLPHVWFPLATRQTLGVALPSGGRPPLGPSSLLPPSFLPPQAGCQALAPAMGGHPQRNARSLRGD